MEPYAEFFSRVAGHGPFPHQVRFHEEEAHFMVVSIPTGLGKTEMVLLDWLYKRPTTRLLWVLPARALTRQIAEVARARAEKVDAKIRVIELMGGEVDLKSSLGPGEPAILVATQDIAISRALNRGYARSPFRWPIDFALLNNDITWVLDEVQLLGDALATSTQLAGFREKWGVFGNTPCLWLSATVDPKWLGTVDFAQSHLTEFSLNDGERQHPEARKRLIAVKRLEKAPPECWLPQECATYVKEHHRPRSLTLVIANRVDRAREIWQHLTALGEDAVLLHSQFRRPDRDTHLNRVIQEKAGIVVSTQVVEAGMDLDAELMITDVAPWASLVQRFGRVNRAGNEADSRILWVDRPLSEKRKNLAKAAQLQPKDENEVCLPYEAEEVRDAAERLRGLSSAAPADLPGVSGRPPYQFVLRRTDLLDLFDTTPDLGGNQLDVSRFVRSGREHDVYLAWRRWGKEATDKPARSRIQDDELCAVPLGQAKGFLKGLHAWVWNHAGRGDWEELDLSRLSPGMRVVVRSEYGGYSPEQGWNPAIKGVVEPIPPAPDVGAEPSNDDDTLSAADSEQSLAEHTKWVVRALDGLLTDLRHLDDALNPYVEDLRASARQHDWGKAHPVFQQTLHGLDRVPSELPAESVLAKQDRKKATRGHSRAWFRHELASALAILQSGGSDLTAYLIAAHHGRIRMQIRSMPGEQEAAGPGVKVARGIREGDVLLAADLDDGRHDPVALHLDLMGMGSGERGERSWSDRMLGLLGQEGPFRLAYLELLLRAADWRGSAEVGAWEGVE